MVKPERFARKDLEKSINQLKHLFLMTKLASVVGQKMKIKRLLQLGVIGIQKCII